MSNTKKQFDFTRYKQRHIALKVLYFGWDYDGLAEQNGGTENTVEHHLFQALTKTCLIESRAKCNYNRCGRTDKGVSSYGQVVNLNVRSNLWDEEDPQNIGLFTPADYFGLNTKDLSKEAQTKQEINYSEALNRVLPDEIRIIAWAPIKEGFSARFSCQSRSYCYIFPVGNLCIESMRVALSYLIGEHDFRNLCSFDLKNGVTNHKRTILSTSIHPIASIDQDTISTSNNHYRFYEVVIVGQAFLYHQIRCIMTVLFLIGAKHESPDLIKDLLNIEKCPARPNYNRASPTPLSLFNCEYEPDNLPLGWIYDQLSLQNLYKHLKNLWLQYKTKSMMIERVLIGLESTIETRPELEVKSDNWKDFGLKCDNMSDIKYIPLMRRPRDEPLESKLEYINKKIKNS